MFSNPPALGEPSRQDQHSQSSSPTHTCKLSATTAYKIYECGTFHLCPSMARMSQSTAALFLFSLKSANSATVHTALVAAILLIINHLSNISTTWFLKSQKDLHSLLRCPANKCLDNQAFPS
ncbi:hypothetical protein Pst134EA_017623 [Puccinia striiformis f. sp. tritici]|uniref:Uncharacterized protein n=3 Tax=Puccinia striiformis TaxID=27350 RepID=A0A2S4UNB9_9BASI|nr:hypothetical protein Pst134EA_017623 [Puccinia striiformis f. sp. tritici]KAI9607203.1 hypothetical protein H4Q26_005719 [Puccinia striiformis f. sp. tritici PST-130]POV98760.1 hypothetical protein PSTT_14212 [Puccinia striiformis]KAH9451014.1 hypothetical protein Pst134EB_018519 [Puccinia striiformis f. sp. tritici]KAH9461315.1 hypothetical protein Pst134EA_017623 [Puccinia striiformis f. sp. tritici]POW21793.1 hypothetical protein PSHT_01994 [Puccinia striiformis]